MSRAGSLSRDPSTLVKRNKNQLCYCTTTEPAQLAGIPLLWCRDPGWKFSKKSPWGLPGEWTKRETGQRSNTLFMRIASPAHVIRPLLWVVLSWKLLNLPLSWFVYERIRLDPINPRVLKIERGLHLKMLESAPFTVRQWNKATFLRGHFAR